MIKTIKNVKTIILATFLALASVGTIPAQAQTNECISSVEMTERVEAIQGFMVAEIKGEYLVKFLEATGTSLLPISHVEIFSKPNVPTDLVVVYSNNCAMQPFEVPHSETVNILQQIGLGVDA